MFQKISRPGNAWYFQWVPNSDTDELKLKEKNNVLPYFVTPHIFLQSFLKTNRFFLFNILSLLLYLSCRVLGFTYFFLILDRNLCQLKFKLTRFYVAPYFLANIFCAKQYFPLICFLIMQ